MFVNINFVILIQLVLMHTQSYICFFHDIDYTPQLAVVGFPASRNRSGIEFL